MIFRSARVLIVSTLLSVTAFAEDVELQTVHVVAEAESSRSSVDEVDQNSFSGFAKRLERKDFASEFSTVSDVLDRTNGVEVRQLGGLGGYSMVTMRGVSGNQLALYVDGMLINSAQSGGAEFNLIPTALIEQIDIYPDFTPVQLSSAGLGGALNIKTLDLYKRRGEASVTQGSYGQERYSLIASDQVSGWGWLAGVNLESADNDFKVQDNNGTPDNSNDDFETTFLNAEYERQTGLLKIGRRWDEDRQLDALLVINHGDRGVPAQNNNVENDASVEVDETRFQARYHFGLGDGDAVLRAYATDTTEWFVDREGNVATGVVDLKTDSRVFGMASIYEYGWRNSISVANVEYRTEQYRQTNRIVDELAVDNERNQLFLSLQNDAYFLQDQLMLSLILRQQWLQDKVNLIPDNIMGFYVADAQDFTELSDSEQSAHAGLAYQMSDTLLIKFNVAQQARVPTMRERFGLQGRLVGNPDLTSEISNNLDVGLVWESSLLALSALYFWKDIDDAIVTQVDGSGTGRADNVGAARIEGAEIELSWTLTEWLGLYLGTTLMDSENRSDVKAEVGKKLPGMVHETYSAALDLTLGAWSGKIRYQFKDELYFTPNNSVQPEGINETVDLLLRYNAERWSVQANLDNALDQEYQEFSRFPGQSRTFSINFTGQF